MSTAGASRAQAVLITGGAGFIGSHLVRRLVADGHKVRVLDNFSTGRHINLAGLDNVDLIEGDIRSMAAVHEAVTGVTAIFHLAALPSVPRSWIDPVASLAVNAHGTANLVELAEAAGVEAFIYSSSSSIYGDQPGTIKSEGLEPRPISPYGYSKLLGEKIALAHGRRGGMRVIALRYFNVYGPRQDPKSPYAAVIPRFIGHLVAGTTAVIYGDGTQTRDFTYVDNVVEANRLAWCSQVTGVAVNVAVGEAHSVLELRDALSSLARRPLNTTFEPPRDGDIRHSQADITLAMQQIGYVPMVQFTEGLERTLHAYQSP